MDGRIEYWKVSHKLEETSVRSVEYLEEDIVSSHSGDIGPHLGVLGSSFTSWVRGTLRCASFGSLST